LVWRWYIQGSAKLVLLALLFPCKGGQLLSSPDLLLVACTQLSVLNCPVLNFPVTSKSIE
jgi:hypothetical protein